MSPVDRTSSRRRWSYLFWLRFVEVMLPSSQLRFTASQRNLAGNRVESQIPELESGENSRRKLQNVVTRSTAVRFPGWLAMASPAPTRVSTGDDGRFEIAIRKSAFLSKYGHRFQDYWKSLTIAASAKGFGPAWIALTEAELQKELTLGLVQDSRIEGLIVDSQGQPVKGAF